MLEVIQRDGTRSKIEDPAAALEVLRHSTSHLMALAVLELFPGTHLGIGPATADGFYYDFHLDHTFTDEDLARIEEKMRELAAADLPFEPTVIRPCTTCHWPMVPKGTLSRSMRCSRRMNVLSARTQSHVSIPGQSAQGSVSL